MLDALGLAPPIILYVFADGVWALAPARASGARLSVVERFALAAGSADAAELARLTQWLRARERASRKVLLLVDTVGETIATEPLPKVGRADRARLGQRRLDVRFRGHQLRAILPAGEPGVLAMASLGQEPHVDRIVEAAVDAGARVGSIASPALLASHALAARGVAGNVLAVSLHPAGLRQTLLVSGSPRFTRLAAFGASGSTAQAVAEVERTMQHMVVSQILKRDIIDRKLRVAVIADGMPDGDWPATIAIGSMGSAPVVLVRAVAADVATSGEGQAIAGLAPWCVAPARARSPWSGASSAYAQRAHRRHAIAAAYAHAAVGAASTALTVAAGWAILTEGDLERAQQLAATQRAAAAPLDARAQKDEERLARLPIQAADVAPIVQSARLLAARHVDVPALLARIARALDDDPLLRIDAIEWSGAGDLASEGESTAAPPSAPEPVAAPDGSVIMPAASAASGPAGAAAGASMLRVRIRGSASAASGRTAANVQVEAFAQRLGGSDARVIPASAAHAPAPAAAARVDKLPFDRSPQATWTLRPNEARSGQAVPFVIEWTAPLQSLAGAPNG